MDEGRIKIRVSDDGLEAWLTVDAGPKAARSDLTARIDELGIVAPVDESILEEAARALSERAALPSPLPLAEGRAPQPGEPAALELVAPGGQLSGAVREDGSLDFRERKLIRPVKAGERIGRIRPATSGIPGMDVFGEVIPAEPGAAFDGKLGEGIRLEENGDLTAISDGARTISGNDTLDVVALYKHEGPVDLASGNLSTDGSLEITRDVTFGMRVSAAADVVVGGTVDGATLIAGNSVTIRGGAIGRDLGSVIAGGDLTLRHALGIRIRSGGTLSVQRSVSSSALFARSIEVGGQLLGIEARAEASIRVKEAGSSGEGPCLLRAAYPNDPMPPIRIAQSEGSRSPEARPKKGSLRGRKPRSRKAGGRRGASGKDAVTRLRERLDWRERERSLRQTAFIEVTGVAHAGCRIDFGGRPRTLEHSRTNVCFRYDVHADQIIEEER